MTDHDHGSPLSYVHALETAWLAAAAHAPRCPHCHVTYRMLPMTGTAWGLEVFHEPDCPNHDDNQPANYPEADHR